MTACPTTLMAFLDYNKWSLAGYGVFALIVFIFRNRFEWHTPLLGMYRSKVGIKLMDNIAKKHTELVKLLGYIGVGVSFTAMIGAIFMILFSMFIFVSKILSNEAAPTVLAPLIPGVCVPGSPIQIPLIEGLIAIFVIAAMHEFCHGVVAFAHGVKIVNTGYVQVGPIAGAFVEPDDKVLEKKEDIVKYSIYAAGAFSNIVLGVIIFLAVGLFFTPYSDSMQYTSGFKISDVTKEGPASLAGIESGFVFTNFNGNRVYNITALNRLIDRTKPGETVTLSNPETSYSIVTGMNPADSGRAYLGVNIETQFEVKDEVNPLWFGFFGWFMRLLNLIFIISIGIGLINLLPMGPIDGGRMFKLASDRIFGNESGNKVWGYISMFLFFLILVMLTPVVFGFLKLIAMPILSYFGG